MTRLLCKQVFFKIKPCNPQHCQYGKSDNCGKKDNNNCTENFNEKLKSLLKIVFFFNLLQTATTPLHFEDTPMYGNARPKGLTQSEAQPILDKKLK